MENDFSGMSREEKLKVENDYLKMKLMLQYGAQMHQPGETPPLPAEIENEFLKNVEAFEELYEKNKRIQIFDKIGRPEHFKPVNELSAEELSVLWKELQELLLENGMELHVVNRPVPEAELYRFVTEKLFFEETDSFTMPGMTNILIYEEFLREDE